MLPAHPADLTVFSTSSTCNLPGRECVLFPMKNVSSSDVVMKGLGLRSLTQAGFPRVLSRSRFAQHVYKFLYVNTEVAPYFRFQYRTEHVAIASIFPFMFKFSNSFVDNNWERQLEIAHRRLL